MLIYVYILIKFSQNNTFKNILERNYENKKLISEIFNWIYKI
jgi:hypothetical protein